jgi:hypothetical protein
MLPADAPAPAVADAVTTLLVDDATRAAAKQMATVIAGYGGTHRWYQNAESRVTNPATGVPQQAHKVRYVAGLGQRRL